MKRTYFELSLDSIRGGTLKNGFTFPSAISSVCPYCNQSAVFSLPIGPFETISRTYTTSGRCPSCDAYPSFTFHYSPEKNEKGHHSIEFGAMYPSPKNHISIIELSDSVPTPLKRAINDAVATYNAGVYSAAVTLGRRSMEGLFKHMVEEKDKDKKLYQLIQLIGERSDLSEPLIKLSHAIREGGNLGAHFDLEREADQETANSVLDLLFYLVSYFYLLPDKVKLLEERVK